mgnify:CR=1 FL=1
MNEFDHELQQPAPSPCRLLYDVMTSHAKSWEAKAHSYGDELATLTELDPNEVTQELLTIWLPVFKFRSSLKFVLESMQSTHQNEIASDICAYYLEVLKGIKQ